MSEEASMSSPSVISPEHLSVVHGYKTVQTREARWLYLEDIYQKFHRPNMYDIGGTYIVDVADYWFQFETQRVADVFLLHVYIWNRNDCSYTVSLSTSNELEFQKKNPSVFLQIFMKQFKFPNIKELKQSYLTTYSFKEVDIELLKDRQLYIPVMFNVELLGDEILDNVKYKHDLGYLLNDPVCSDFTIEVLEGFKFKVHQAVLAESSEFFKAMFKDDTAESQSGCLKLIDVSKEDFQGVLEFIYTGSIADIENYNIFNILQLADRFNLPGLLDLCQYVLAQHLSTDNALETLVYADIYNASVLKNAALKMIKSNKSIVKSSVFKEIKSVDLARELCEYLVSSE